MSKDLHLFLFCLLFSLTGFAQSVNFSSSNLPIVIINTNGQTIPDEPKIMADMGMINNPNGARNTITDSMNEYKGKIGIEVRGESSQMFPMKSYSIELRKATGSSQDLPMLGMPKESDWVLYAPYTDKTLMRNFLAYTMSRELGHWSANCRFVEVVLNGN
ncbi:MAG: CotH kinase family protein, partial [Chitinophagaceae bacterium]